MGPFLVAVGFLTRVPVGRRGHGDLAAAAWAFPVVGALVGAAVGLVGTGAALVVPVLVAAVLGVLAEVLLTGALHLDGLADSADGTGGPDREARLRIMKDHATGVYGTAAVVLDLLLKVALVHAVLELAEGWPGVLLLAAGYAVSRAGALPPAAWLASARPGGTGGYLVSGLTPRRAGLGLVAAVGIVLLCSVPLALDGGPHLLRATGLALVGGALGVVAVATWARRTLGGVTGDALGATIEVALLLSLLGVVAGL